MVRPPSFDSSGMKKGAWSEEEDNKLRAYVLRYGHWNWRLLPKYAGLARCGKSCRLRWVNYLKPGIKKGGFSKEEQDLIIKLHAQLGNKWSAIATKLPGRTDNEVKNFWHTRVEKRQKRNRAAKKVGGHTSEASSEDQVSEKEKTREESVFSEANSLNRLQPSTPSLDANNSLIPTTQSQVDLWPDIFQADPNYHQTDYTFPPLIEDELFYPEFHYSELSSLDSSYMSALDWRIADDDHNIMSSEHIAPSAQGSFWSESSASNTSNPQSEGSSRDVDAFYDPLFQCFDFGMNLFS